MVRVVSIPSYLFLICMVGLFSISIYTQIVVINFKFVSGLFFPIESLLKHQLHELHCIHIYHPI